VKEAKQDEKEKERNQYNWKMFGRKTRQTQESGKVSKKLQEEPKKKM
jgi:hypothetical protein